MTEADVQRLLAEKKIRTASPDPETAQAEIDRFDVPNRYRAADPSPVEETAA